MLLKPFYTEFFFYTTLTKLYIKITNLLLYWTFWLQQKKVGLMSDEIGSECCSKIGN